MVISRVNETVIEVVHGGKIYYFTRFDDDDEFVEVQEALEKIEKIIAEKGGVDNETVFEACGTGPTINISRTYLKRLKALGIKIWTLA